MVLLVDQNMCLDRYQQTFLLFVLVVHLDTDQQTHLHMIEQFVLVGFLRTDQ